MKAILLRWKFTAVQFLLLLVVSALFAGCASMSQPEQTQFNPAVDRFAMFVLAVPGNVRQGTTAGTFGTDPSGAQDVARFYKIRWVAPNGQIHQLESATLPLDSAALTVRLRLDQPGITPGTWKLQVEGPNAYRLTKTFEVLRPAK